MRLGFWLRWSLRDLRQRWLQVLAIALIVALGTGVFAGLGSQQEWREDSYDENFARQNMYDLRLTFTEGTYVDATEIEATLADISGIADLELRLVAPTLIEAQAGDETVLQRAKIIGVELSDGPPEINQIHIWDGRGLEPDDTGENTALVHHLFARYYDLEPGDSLTLAGDISLDFVGTGQSPDHFQIIPDTSGTFLGESSLAILYMPLSTTQRLMQREGRVNEVVMVLDDSADREAVQDEIDATLENGAFSGASYALINKQNDPVYELLYSDAEGDQQMMNIIALLFLFGAALAAFNLAGRIVQAQRRQIGIGMALGVQRFWLAFRPMLMGFQIALMGTVFGLLLGYGFSQLFAGFFEDNIVLPYWEDPFYLESYVQAAALGILIPFLATLYPVWQAVRVQPIDAIKTSTLVSKGGGLAPAVQNIPLPGRSFTQMPLRNLLRAPWRTLFTLTGIGIAILLLTAMIGLLDTFEATIDQGEEAYLYEGEDRLTVGLDNFYEVESDQVEQIRRLTTDEGTPLFATTEAGLTVGGELMGEDEEISVSIELLDPENRIWTPKLLAGEFPRQPDGIVIAEKAANDLNLSVGDSVTVQHPVREGRFNLRSQESTFEITGIHNNPLRPLTYMNLSSASLMGLEGRSNTLSVLPVEGVSEETVRRGLFNQRSVTSVQAVSELNEAFEDAIDILRDVLWVIQFAVIALAFLIAFNSTSINLDERIREIATMFAFGLPVRTVTRMQMIENVVTGVLGTIVGLLLGYGAVVWITTGQIEEMFPEIQFGAEISAQTMLIALAIGILVVTLTPLLSVRRMVTMDIPSTLRVME
jgi:putative ABC transport system permease protein